MKYLTTLLIFGALLMLTYGPEITPANAQNETDTIRDMLILVHDKQPDTQVTLYADWAGKYYEPYGPISHIGDDYVCVMQTVQNGPLVYTIEKCVSFKWLISVEMNPGIHR